MKCKRCDFITGSPKALYIHITRRHTVNKRFPCVICGNSYKTLHSYKNHKRNKRHRIFSCCASVITDIIVKVKARKPYQQLVTPNKSLIINNIDVGNRETSITFMSSNSLLDYVYTNLNKDRYNFVLKAGRKGNKDYLMCNYRQDGVYTCSSYYTTEETEDKLWILKFYISHNHPTLYNKLRIPQSVKAEIIDRIKKGVELRRIYEDILEQINDVIKSKYDLITMAYLRYIKNSFTVRSRLDNSDKLSLLKNIEIYIDTSVICESSLICNTSIDGGGEFLMCFQTKSQAELLKKGQTFKTLLMDSTHGTNQYNYKLIIASVLNKNCRPRPIFSCITSCEDTPTLIKMFEKLKSTTMKSFTTEYLMTDMATQFNNVYKQIFAPDVKWLYCLWHFKRAIKKNILFKIKDQETRTTITELFNQAIYERTVTMFRKKYKEFLDTAKLEANEFYEYFNSRYTEHVGRWALAFRTSSEVNTNMFQERMFGTFKKNYLNRVKQNRLDFLFEKLNKFDNHIDKILLRSKYTNATEEKGYRIQCIRKNHTKADKMSHYRVTKGKRGYNINNYRVYLKAPYICDKSCQLRCETCHLCMHCVSCTCLNFLSTKQFCKHIHYLASKMIENGNKLGYEMDINNRMGNCGNQTHMKDTQNAENNDDESVDTNTVSKSSIQRNVGVKCDKHDAYDEGRIEGPYIHPDYSSAHDEVNYKKIMLENFESRCGSILPASNRDIDKHYLSGNDSFENAEVIAFQRLKNVLKMSLDYPPH